jgi:predicted O-linked N-acetylglucosamine transferase (SPINDLY family)
MPGPGEALGRRGLALLIGQRFAEAEIVLREAITLDPADAIAHNALGIALIRQGRTDDAIAAFRAAIAANPMMADVHSNLGHALHRAGRFADAEASCRAAIALHPDHADAFNNLGNALKAQDRLRDAVDAYRRALALKPDLAEAHHNLAPTLTELGRADEAIAAYRAAMAIPACHAKARFGLCIAQLPILCADEAELGRRHDAYARELAALESDVARQRDVIDFTEAVGAHQPFYLAYHGRNERDLQRRYGELVCGIMAARFPPPALPVASSDEPIRVGFVSGYFHHHSIWKIPLQGWLRQLDRTRFRLFGYHTGARADDATQVAASLCERFVYGPIPLESWRETILADAPHVLIYPEIGMDPVAGQLAALRLARVQCNAIGHPITSGLPTIDYFLTSKLMEPNDGQDHYTETLVRLPGLSVHYEPLYVTALPLTHQELGLRRDATVYWCGQSLYKFLPRHDDIFPRIARAAGNVQFVFIEHGRGGHVTDLFRTRLDRAFATHGLRATDHCVILQRMPIQRFLGVMGQCDVFLDSLGWSGFNTAMESLAQALPIVTLPGATMRACHSTGVLRMLGVTDTIATSLDDYVTLAVRLARDPAWRAQVHDRMRANRDRAWQDRRSIAGLASFLERVARQSAASDIAIGG